MDKFLKKGQRGQTIVEFALVLPLFMLIVLAIGQFGMMFSDYSTLQNIARSTAREVALTGDTSAVKTKIKNEPPDLFVYDWKDGDFDAKIPTEKEKKAGDEDVTITIHTSLNKNTTFYNYVLKVLEKDRGVFDINITYKMYNESGKTS